MRKLQHLLNYLSGGVHRMENEITKLKKELADNKLLMKEIKVAIKLTKSYQKNKIWASLSSRLDNALRE